MYRKTQGLPAFGKHSRAESARSTYLSSRKNKKTWLPKNTLFETTAKDLAAPQGFEPRYADPELRGSRERFSGDPLFHSITCHNSGPHGSAVAQVSKSPVLAHTGSIRMARL